MTKYKLKTVWCFTPESLARSRGSEVFIEFTILMNIYSQIISFNAAYSTHSKQNLINYIFTYLKLE